MEGGSGIIDKWLSPTRAAAHMLAVVVGLALCGPGAEYALEGLALRPSICRLMSAGSGR